MTTESKKLQTDVSQLQHALDDPGHSTLGIITALRPSFLTCIHDARIAHEQREVICELVKAIKLVRRGVGSMPSSFGFEVSEIPCIDRVLAAAAPYILEDWTPNAETIAAMEECRSGNLKSVATVEELMADLNSESED